MLTDASLVYPVVEEEEPIVEEEPIAVEKPVVEEEGEPAVEDKPSPEEEKPIVTPAVEEDTPAPAAEGASVDVQSL